MRFNQAAWALAAALVLVALAAFMVPTPTRAQSGPFGLGTVTLGSSGLCPTGPTSGWLSGMTCQNATVSCLSSSPYNVQDIGVTYGYATPGGTPKGTIVILTGDGGTSPTDEISLDAQYASDYLTKYNYQAVLVQWQYDWEDTANGGGGANSNVGYAACRQYTLLNYIYTTLYAAIYNSHTNPTAGMCVQGESAGAAATTFALAWYGGTSFIDKVELMSGPTLSRIDMGCQVANPPQNSVGVCPPGQFGCNLGSTGTEWTSTLLYTGKALASVREWTGNQTPACNGGTTTTPAENQSWEAMSVADSVHATFNYPYTRMTGWLCSSVTAGVMNNSSGQGEEFYQLITSGTQVPKFYQLNDVQNCTGPENVSTGAPPQSGFSNGMAAIEFDMASPLNPSNNCQKVIRQ
jgi:hypothetical protein